MPTLGLYQIVIYIAHFYKSSRRVNIGYKYRPKFKCNAYLTIGTYSNIIVQSPKIRLEMTTPESGTLPRRKLSHVVVAYTDMKTDR